MGVVVVVNDSIDDLVLVVVVEVAVVLPTVEDDSLVVDGVIVTKCGLIVVWASAMARGIMD